jgi:DNA topoisomerase-3
MRLFIAEKPELARAIVEGLGGGPQRNGYYECANNDVVTFCFGHMLSLKDPEDYDPAFEKWSMDQLPMSFIPWEYKPNESSEKQLNIILSLLSKSTSVVHAGDPDPEGQLLVDEILKYAGYDKPVYRVLINDNNLKPVQAALANLKSNADFKGLSLAAEARSVADQLFGYNLTRCYTLAASAEGFQGVMSLGRVQTPVLGLIVRRDLEHEAHIKSHFYTIAGQFKFGDTTLTAKYKIAESDPVDDSGRINDPVFASTTCESVTGHNAIIKNTKTSTKQEKAPLPYNLLKLQVDASRKFGYKPDFVLDVTQSLREKHRVITYNRSDCQYLGDNHHEAAPAVLQAISKTAPALNSAAAMANPTIKSRAFDTSKVSAHHAIIPTETVANFDALSDAEQRIYMLIARAYIAQFFPSYEYDETVMQIESEGFAFGCTSKVGKKPGWKSLYRNDVGNEEVETDGDSLTVDLSYLKSGTNGLCSECSFEKKETAPAKRYVLATLLNDLTRVAKYIHNPKLRALLIERDKSKEDEHGGIGTSATRSTIIKGLFERGFIEEKGKSIISTRTAREFYAALPDVIRYPDMTALWHEQQLKIENGSLSVNDFIAQLMSFIEAEVNKVKELGIKGLTVQKVNCPKCSKLMRRINGAKGPFWACTGFSEGCKHTCKDIDGKPQIVHQKPTARSTEHKCNLCKTGLRRVRGAQSYIWICGNVPKCKQQYPEKSNAPDYSNAKIK